MLCSVCGNPVSDGERFCRVCGTQVSAASFAPPSPAVAVAATGPPATSGKAIASLVCGISFLLLPAAIVAIIFGHLSLSEIRKSAGRLKGEGIAIAGLVLGYLGVLAIPFVLIIAAIAIPNLLRARIAANETSAVASVRAVANAEVAYSSQHPDAGYTCSLSDLTASGIHGDLAAGRKNGYIFELSGCDSAEGAAVTKYQLVAYPEKHNQTGIRVFCTDQSGVINFDSNGSTQNCLEGGSVLT